MTKSAPMTKDDHKEVAATVSGFFWTILTFAGNIRIIILLLYPPLGRLSVPLGRLSPMGAFGGRYNTSTTRETWIIGPARGRGRKDVYAIMPPDLETYGRYLDRYDLTEAEKVEFIHTLWAFLGYVVDRAFEGDPVPPCRDGLPPPDSTRSADGVDWKGDAFSDEFNKLAERPAGESDSP